jgi:hypothetical protein
MIDPLHPNKIVDWIMGLGKQGIERSPIELGDRSMPTKRQILTQQAE